MASNYRSENVLFLLSYIIGTIVFGLVIGFISLLISYAILTGILNLGLIPTDSFLYGLILTVINTAIDTLKAIFERVSGWIF